MLIRFAMLALLCALTLPTFTAQAEQLVLTNGEWPPYFSPNFEHDGPGSRIVTEAFADVGIDVEYAFMPWKRSLHAARAGDYDGAVAWRWSEEWAKDFLYSDPILWINSVFFHRKDVHIDWETLDDLGHLRLGGTLGYSHEPYLQEAALRNGGSYEAAPTDELNLQKLAEKRIDVFPCDYKAAQYLLKNKLPPEVGAILTFHPKIFLEGELYLLISKKTPNGKEIVARFNKGLKKLKESGRYDQYLAEPPRKDSPRAP
ncbi:ABC transporter substrate-binding protein [Pseudodesulfovibrio sp. zrk46]|uniref:substrate-binding periplasmic protein n=1 Tax=Pseudodesulfovibrio sp. zrk46 TaxID=2725288 RepID=UPI0014499379|nr:ABC transporter substrate-binding protein [Pseudodesulfovibrio sp. zrk46]QJB55567.1 amino acid ABC transporter substrate-binding protein [Pseudodesulfovibrio sp. zrk46]